MNYKSELQSNNTDLQSILDTVNALTDAGSGGGGASVETCTVTITKNKIAGALMYVMVTQYIDGMLSTYMVDFPEQSTLTFENVVCNTGIGFVTMSAVIPSYSVSGGASYNLMGQLGYLLWYFTAPSTAGAAATITVWDAD